jgi:hypothetical protein
MKALIQVFFEPGKLFGSLPEGRGVWILPVIANVLLFVVISWLVPHYVGRENVARRQLEAFSGRMSADQLQTAMARANSPANIYSGYVIAAIGIVVVLMGIAGILMVFSMMSSHPPSFGAMLAMTALAFFPYWLITSAMTALILISSPDPASLDIRNPIATNPAAYMDKNSMAKGLYSLFSSLDVLSFAEIGLLAYGFAKVTRVHFLYGFTAVVGMWILYVSAKMALSLLF